MPRRSIVCRAVFCDQLLAIFLTAAGDQAPLMIDGAFSFGQYIRSIRTNLPDGAGSQFDSLSGFGESFWM